MWYEALLTRKEEAPEVHAPRWLGERDLAWIRALFDVHAEFVGRPRLSLVKRLEAPLSETLVSPLRAKLAAARRVLAQLAERPPALEPPPRELRGALFGAGASRAQPRTVILEAVGGTFALGADDVLRMLFADLSHGRAVTPLPSWVTPERFATRVNAEIAAAIVGKARSVRIEVEGGARTLMHEARRRGLLVVERAREAGDAGTIEISGPFSLFRHGTLYAHALGSLVPALSRTGRFRLRAVLPGRDRVRTVELGTGDPIFDESVRVRTPGAVSRRTLRVLAAELEAAGWRVERDPPAVEAPGLTVLPDLVLVDPAGRRVLLEIGGFWTPGHVRARIRRIEEAGLDAVICVERSRNCGETESLPPRAVLYERMPDHGLIVAAALPGAAASRGA